MLGAIRDYAAGDEKVSFRPEDEAECGAAAGGSCAESIRWAVSAGCKVQVVLDPRTAAPFAFFGMVPEDAVAGRVWMLATPAIQRNARTLHAHTAAVIDEWHRQRPLLHNIVDARNTLHIRWLKRLGFTFIKLHARAGTAQIPFYEFVRLSNV